MSIVTSGPVPTDPLPFNIHTQLKSLRHEKKNQAMQRLPANTTISRRPINHAPVADIHAGAHVSKCVYVSQRTPIMAAVKRVKKILKEVERRALQEAMGGRIGGRGMARDRGGAVGVAQGVAKANEALGKGKEEVLVKATGRAMAQALKVGEWFRTREKEMLCEVVVRTASVSVVDNIVELEQEEEVAGDGDEDMTGQDDSRVECGDTTLELLGDISTSTIPQVASSGKDDEITDTQPQQTGDSADGSMPIKKPRKRKRKKRSVYDDDDVPEARLRWVKTVEVAISLKA